MMRSKKIIVVQWLAWAVLWLLAPLLRAQPPATVGTKQVPAPTASISLEVGPATLPVTGTYTLAFRLRGAALQDYSAFPEIEGFKKGRKTSTTTTHVVQGRSFSELIIKQTYLPYGEGEFTVPPFQMTVNGQTLSSPGALVRVGSTLAAPNVPTEGDAPGVASLDKLFGKPKASHYEEVPDHGQLVLEADHESVFVGEEVRVGVFFYLLPADQELLAFHDFDEQLPRMLRQLHQPNAWEAPGPPLTVRPDTVRRAGQRYLRFRLAESVYYPLTAKPLEFPPLALTMTKFKPLKKSEPGDPNNRLATYKTYLTPALRVAVRPLPPLPATSPAEVLPVGDYQLQESVAPNPPRTGVPFTYTLALTGTGNLAALLTPAWAPYPGLDSYGPEVREAPTPGGGRKVFRYRLVARRPGRLPLDSLLQVVIFNPRTARYDTLRPTLRPVVRGELVAADRLPKPEEDPFYGPALERADAEIQPLDLYSQVRRYADWLLVGLAVVAGYGFFKNRRKAEQS